MEFDHLKDGQSEELTTVPTPNTGVDLTAILIGSLHG